MDGEQGRHASALGVDAAHQMAGALGSDHHDVDIFRGLDGFEMDGEAVGEAENFAFAQMRLDGFLVELGHGLVGRENLDPVGALGGFGGGKDDHSIGGGLFGRFAIGIEADDDVVSAVAEVLRLGVALGAVAEDGNGFALEGGWVGVVLVEDCGHGKAP